MKQLKHLLNKFKDIKAILKLGWFFYDEDYYKKYEEENEDKYLDIVTILSRKNR
jgi:hypothetical protein